MAPPHKATWHNEYAGEVSQSQGRVPEVAAAASSFSVRGEPGISTMSGGFAATVYNSIFKKTSTFALVTIVGAVFLERMSDVVADTIFDTVNKGKQWKDIKKNYE
uniref:Cytochrome b-c1 complex subunit 9 n=1 Tax=Amblyomma maculatum TaxID=34609 RepID=G3MN52_AMBMU